MPNVTGVCDPSKLAVRLLLPGQKDADIPQTHAQHYLPLSSYSFLRGPKNPLARAHDCRFVCKSISSKTGGKNDVIEKLHHGKSDSPAGFKEITKLAQAAFTGLMPGSLGHPSPLGSSA